jgi:RNA polymerase sigma factor (sigma-70 family)
MDDAALAAAAQSGDRHAFGELVGRHRAGVQRLCYRVTGSLPDAEDLAHEAFTEAWVKLDRLRDPARFAPWLRTIALNLCRMWHRRARPALPLAAEIAGAPVPSDDHARVLQGLCRVSVPHRVALVLHYWEGLPYEDIARFLDLPVGTVMSRLHRARHSLRDLMEKMNVDDAPAMAPDDDFRREVDAEIDALLALAPSDRTARERLSVVMRRSPGRFATVIAAASTDEKADDLALLIGRVGRPGLQVALGCRLSRDPALRDNARRLLIRFVGHAAKGVGDERTGRLQWRTHYHLLDLLIESAMTDEQRAEIALEWLDAAPNERVAALLLGVLMGYRDAAFPLLLDRFLSSGDDDGRPGDGAIVQALCRSGARFACVLVDVLQNDPIGREERLLHGAEAVARTFAATNAFAGWLDLPVASEERVVTEQRFRLKWAPLLERDRDPEAVVALGDAVARYIDDARPRLRAAAMRVLGILGSVRHLPALEAQARSEDRSVRIAAIRAVADIGVTSSLPLFIDRVAAGERDERRVAAEALGRLRAVEALPVLRDLLQDNDREVQRAAISALGAIGGEVAEGVLREVVRSPDKSLARAASSALFGGVKRGNGGTAPRDWNMADQVRDGANPHAFISLEAAIRAIPEPGQWTEPEFSRLIAQACVDFATTRRYMVEEGLIRRESGVYALTEAGEAMWRVERFIRDSAANGDGL